MLLLSRKKNEKILIGDNIELTFCGYSFKYGEVTIGIEAPKDVAIIREEIAHRYQNKDKKDV